MRFKPLNPAEKDFNKSGKFKFLFYTSTGYRPLPFRNTSSARLVKHGTSVISMPTKATVGIASAALSVFIELFSPGHRGRSAVHVQVKA